MQESEIGIIKELSDLFCFSLQSLLPAVIMMVFPLFNIGSFAAMLLSSLIAVYTAVTAQEISIAECFRCLVMGYACENPNLSAMLNGGGMLGMAEICLIVCISVNLLPVMNRCGFTEISDPLVTRAVKRIGRTGTAACFIFASNMIFCNQTVPLYLTEQCMNSAYETDERDAFVLDVSDANIIGGAVPWSVSCSVPLALMGADLRCLLFAFFIWVQPAIHCLHSKNK